MSWLRATPAPTHTHLNVSVQRQLDWLMLAVVCLCCTGLVMAVSVQSLRPDSGALPAMKLQGAKLVAGLVAFLVCASVPMALLRRFAVPIFSLAAIMVFATILGPELNGAQRWLWVGRLTFQPVEFARLALIVATAALLARAGGHVREFRSGFMAVMWPAGVLALGLVLQPDHGNALLCVMLAVAIGLAGGVAVWWFAAAAIPLIPALVLAVMSHDYAIARVTHFLSAEPGHRREPTSS